jgi:MFS family permease
VLGAFVAFNLAEWGTWVAIIVYAFDQGGATTAGLIAVLQLVPAALVAPLVAGAADRRRPAAVLTGGYVLQSLAYALTATALLLDVAPLFVYASAVAAACAVTITRPAQAALTPGLARTPDELTATNVASGWIRSVSTLAAPTAAGLILALSGPGAVFAAGAAVSVAATLLVFRIDGPPPASRESREEAPLAEAMAGFRLIRSEPEPRLLVLLLGFQYVALGALDILFVVLAIDVLHQRESWAGYLNAAFGAGGVLAIGATALLVGRQRLAPAMLAGAAMWLAALVGLAVNPGLGSALLLLGAAGAGQLLIDVAGRTLLQRTAPPAFLSRLFGVLEGISMAALAVGSLLTPLLIAVFGERGAIAGVGLFMALGTLVLSRRLLRIDADQTVPVVEIALLRSMALFRALPPPQLEALARSLELVPVTTSNVVIREGDSGDRFYAIGDGRFQVSAEGVVIAELTRGDGFGEIALLRDIPRVATVTPLSDGLLYALEKDAFLSAVTGHSAVTSAADSLAEDRLQDLERRLGSRA